MNSKRQVKPQPKKSTDNEFVFTEPQQNNDGNFQFTEPAEKKSKLMIFLIAGGGVVLLLALSILAKGLFSSHKDDVAEEYQPEEIEVDTKLTTYEGFDISQITDPPLVPSKHKPGEKRTLYCKGQAFVFRWCPPGRFMMGSPSSEYPPGTGHCYSGSNFSDSDLDAIGDAMGYSKQEKEEIIEQAHDRAFVASCIPDFNSHGRSEEEVLHPVTLTEGFWMLETEITHKQYGAIYGYSGFNNNKPYYSISWDDSQKFCSICSQQGMKVQLPTEAQWEYACRAGTQTAFCFGDSYNDLCKYGNYCDISCQMDNEINQQSYQDQKHNDGFQFYAPVKSFRPNAWGLYDMHGNVEEWCSDPYGGYIIEHEVNPTGDKEYTVILVGIATPKTLYDKIKKRDNSKHVVRGGAYINHFVCCRSASREGSDSRAGFRVMMTDKNMNDALANHMDQPPKEETVKEPVEEDNKDNQSNADSSKKPSDISNNNNAADNGDFDDLLPDLSSGSKTSEPELSDSESLDSQPSDVGRSHIESNRKRERKAGDTLVKEIDREKFVFKWIPPGIFTMGSPSDEEGRNPNERQYKVKISKGFWMMDSEVTQEQWMAVIGDVPSSRASFKKPKENVSWYDCKNFCKKAASAGLPLELPTEAQWEYACRAGTKGSFAGDFEEMTWHYGNSDRHAQNIRTKTPNQWGLYDMHGNVAEWVADWCGPYPGKPTKDPKGPDDGDKKMTRGGSWGSPKHFCRSALRGGLEPDQHTVGLGFRCVLNSDQDADGSSNNDRAKRPTSAASNASKNREAPDTASNTNNRGDCFVNRSSGKARAVAMGGGTTESERAVGLGLQWIANHQLPNGAWSFNHQLSPSCRGACNNPGKLDKAFNGATGLAMLPFLGAGVTHNNEGKYKTNVDKGINYLCLNGKQTKDGCVSFLESGGTIYSHGIVALCLTEAYGMTKDKKILPVAQGSLNYIYFHQDPNGGGWRYQPHQEGDASATGWQVSAIKTGYMSGLEVPKDVIRKASQFLSSVQTDSGAKYGYTEPGAGPSTTSVGLLCRMYFGWRHDNPALQRGVEWLSKIGPSKSDSYYNYYATQVMYQYNVQQNAGPMWKKWNAIMRDLMVNSQSQQEHAKGSWYHSGPWSERGGRLYDTALSIMVLETYYRYPSVYKSKTDD